MNRFCLHFLICFSILLVLPGWAQQEVYVDAAEDFIPANPANGDIVTWNGTGGGVTGLVFGTDAFATVQEGIDVVDEGGTVFIAAGEYQKGSVITVPEDKSLTLQGDGVDFTTLSRDDSQGADSANMHSVLATSASVGGSSIVSIDGMTVSGGRSIDSGSGGGISSTRGTLLVSNCKVSGNTGARSFGSGGGIGGDEVTIVVNSSTVSGNVSEASGSGGGIGGLNPSITVINSIVNGNTSEGNSSGGGIGGAGATITVNNSMVSGNVSVGNSSGGGVGGRFSSITVSNCTVSGNTSEDQFSGGGIGGNSSTITVINSTVSGNTSEGVESGGGIGGNLIGSLTLGNSLVVGNVAAGATSSSEINGSISTDNGGNLLSIPSGLNISDILAPLADNGGSTLTHALVPGSPAIDAGVNANAVGLDFDQRGDGFPRILDSLVDVGAFELSSAANVYVDAAGDFTPANPANGETVTWNGLSQGGPITGLIFGQNAFETVQESIDVVAESGTVFIAAGEYQKGSVITVPEDKSLTLHGDGADLTILSRDDSADAHSILSTSGENSTVTVDGMTISNGIANGRVSEGGGITSNRGNLVVMNSIVSGNRSLRRSSGGGIGGFLPTITVTNSIVSGNTSENFFSGGGIGGDSPMITVTNSTVSDNANTENGITGSSGGGIGGDRPTIIVTNSTVSDNTVSSDSSGGGIGGNNPTITVNNSTVRGNTSASLSSGGGIGGDSPTITVNNSTIIGNTSEDSASGGGIGGDRPTIIVNNSTVSGNTSAGISSGGGIGGNRPMITVNNSTVSSNTSEGDSSGGGIGGVLVGSLTLGNSLIVGNVATGSTSSADVDVSISTDNGGNVLSIPSGLNISDILAPLADNGGSTLTHALVPGSPAIDTGVNANAVGLDFDQRGDGFPRILDSLVDVGAFEFSSAVNVYVDAAGDFTPANPANGETVTWNGLSQGGPVTGLIFGRNAFGSVQEGIDAVSESGTVFIAAGEYQKGSVIFVFDKSLTLQGDGAEFTTLSRDDSAGASSTNKHSVLATRQSGSGSSTVIIDGMTISGGRSAFNRGGGGGITSSGGAVIVNNSTVSDNTSEEFSSGGGIGGNRLTITVNNSTVSGNTSEGVESGGGIGGNSPTIIVNNSTVSGNTSKGRESGGGIGGDNAIITVNSSTVSGNTSEAVDSGGGIGGDRPRITVNNSTISDNTSESNSSGGGIGGLGPRITMNNSLVVGNVTMGSNSPREVRGNVTNDSGGNLRSIPSGLIISDILAPLADNGGPTQTHALVVGSPAIDSGVNDLAGPETDQRGDGFPRVIEGTVDIGAFEFPANTAPVLTVASTSVQENTASVVVDVSAADDRDAEGSGLVYSLTGADAGEFSLNANTGEISFASAPDFETPTDVGSDNVYNLTVTVTDAGDLTDSSEITITVTNQNENTPPVISLNGPASITLECAVDSYTELATASDALDDDATLNLMITGGPVNTLVPDTYTLTYNVTDSGGLAAEQLTRTVIVQDTTAPVITLSGGAILQHEAGTPFTDPGTTLEEVCDTALVVGSAGAVDVDRLGSYTLTYTATDSSGNAAMQQVRTVTVVDTIPPVITLNNPAPITLTANIDTYTEPGATATDSFDPDVDVTNSGSVDTTRAGSYTITYTARDGSLNEAVETRTVQVVETPAYSIAALTTEVTEGNNSTVPMTFTVSRVGTTDRAGSVEAVVSLAGSVTADDISGNARQVVNFEADQTSKEITFLINGDELVELDEQVSVVLENALPQGAQANPEPAVGTINDNDQALVSINSVETAEGDLGQSFANFTLTLSAPVDAGVSIESMIAPGSDPALSVEPEDIITTMQTSTFPAGSTAALELRVELQSDRTVELDETYLVNLLSVQSGGRNVTLDPEASVGLGVITNDDEAVITVTSDLVAVEDAAGGFPVTFSLDQPVEVDVTFTAATQAVTAGSGDFTETSETVTFSANSTEDQTINIPLINDAIVERSESLNVNLTALAADGRDVSLQSVQANLTIEDEDEAQISINSVTQSEGLGDSSEFIFTVSTTAEVDSAVSVDFTTADGSAVAPGDYTTSSGTITFPANSTESQEITISVLTDGEVENDESFFVNLSNIRGPSVSDRVSFANDQGIGTIQNGDNARVSISDAAVTEGSNGTVQAQFTLTLDKALPNSGDGPAFTVDVATLTNGTASAADFSEDTGTTISFQGTALEEQTYTVDITDDQIVEGSETFQVRLLNLQTNGLGVQLGDSEGTGTILDTDSAIISLTLSDATEGDTGDTGILNYSVVSDAIIDGDVSLTLDFSGTAIAGSDFSDPSFNIITLTSGSLTQGLALSIFQDDIAEPEETIILIGSNLVTGGRSVSFTNNSTFTVVNATLTDDDFAPVVNPDGPYTTSAGEMLTVSVADGLLINDTDQDSGQAVLSVSLTTDVTNGRLALNSDGSFTYQPEEGFDGIDAFSYTVSDGTNTTPGVASISVSSAVDIAIEVEQLEATVVAGGASLTTFRVTATNNGPSDATGVTITRNTIFPAGVEQVAAVPSVGAFDGGIWALDLTNEESQTLTVTIQATTTAASGSDAITFGVELQSTDQLDTVASNNFASASASVINPIDVNLVETVAPVLNLQNGLFTGQVTVTNTSEVDVRAFRLFVTGFPSDVNVANATGEAFFEGVESPYLLSNTTLAAGLSTVLTVEFRRPSLDPNFSANYGIEILTEREVTPVPAISGTNVTRTVILTNGDFLIEFDTIVGATYTVEYSSDMNVWLRVQPSFEAAANVTQWVDNGAPKTSSHPSTVGQRFYRVVLLTQPAN